MKNLKRKEEEVLSQFKQVMLLDKDGQPSEVPVIYATPDKILEYIRPNSDSGYYEFVKKSDTLRLPVIGLHTISVGHNHFVMEGIVYTLYQNDLTQLLEQFHHTVEDLHDNITVSNINLNSKSIWPQGGAPGINVHVGEFTVEYRE